MDKYLLKVNKKKGIQNSPPVFHSAPDRAVLFAFLLLRVLHFCGFEAPRTTRASRLRTRVTSYNFSSVSAPGERPVLACALPGVQRVPDFTWQPQQLLHQREGGFLQSGLFSVRDQRFCFIRANATC